MYHIRSIRAGRSSSCSFENLMFRVLRVGRLPGRLASSKSWPEGSMLRRIPELFGEESLGMALSSAVETDGWDMLFCPTIMSPFSSPAAMWWEKLELLE